MDIVVSRHLRPAARIIGEYMEDLSIIQYIANYGMPAVMSVVLIVMLYNERKDNKEEQRRMRETIDGLKDVVKDNTSLMQTIKQMIEDLLK